MKRFISNKQIDRQVMRNFYENLRKNELCKIDQQKNRDKFDKFRFNTDYTNWIQIAYRIFKDTIIK